MSASDTIGTVPDRWSGRLLQDMDLTAASFIVTIYGDVVVPRGEVLWMGSLIDICGRVGISESLVRTATSRLAAAGRLEGERDGRRSFYRLAPAARAEFAEAAQLLYTDYAEFERWSVLYAPDLSPEVARRHRMGRMSGDVWLCPDIGGETPEVGLTLPVSLPLDAGELATMAGFWDLTDLQSRYDAMIGRFSALARALESGGPIGADDALMSRLLLVHVYRSALLRDPCLPRAALPANWHGLEARRLFKALYLALSPAAEAEIGRALHGRDGPLPVRTRESEARLKALRQAGTATI